MKIENINFKAKRLENKEWVCGYFYQECDNTYIIKDRQKESMLHRNEAVLIDPSTVCMFTGLKDCDGKEIWEGDIIRNPEFPFEKRTVTWNDVYPSFEPINKDGYENRSFTFLVLSKKWTVVGNKFDKEKQYMEKNMFEEMVAEGNIVVIDNYWIVLCKCWRPEFHNLFCYLYLHKKDKELMVGSHFTMTEDNKKSTRLATNEERLMLFEEMFKYGIALNKQDHHLIGKLW